jgi:hypothetical protein
VRPGPAPNSMSAKIPHLAPLSKLFFQDFFKRQI